MLHLPSNLLVTTYRRQVRAIIRTLPDDGRIAYRTKYPRRAPPRKQARSHRPEGAVVVP